MKKWTTLTLTGLATLSLLTACGKQETKEEKTYDTEFITDLGKGLDQRWNYTDDPKNASEIQSKKGYTTAVEKELTTIEKYQDLKFKNSKLKEEAISYINVLKDSKKIAASYGSDSFITKWNENYKKRNEDLIDINNIQKITVSKEHENTLDELLSVGQEVKNTNAQNKKIEDLVNSITFTKDEARSDEFSSTYTATAENTTGLKIKYLSVSLKLIDESGTVVDTQYIHANNWNPSEKQLFEITSPKNFVKIEKHIDNQVVE